MEIKKNKTENDKNLPHDEQENKTQGENETRQDDTSKQEDEMLRDLNLANESNSVCNEIEFKEIKVKDHATAAHNKENVGVEISIKRLKLTNPDAPFEKAKNVILKSVNWVKGDVNAKHEKTEHYSPENFSNQQNRITIVPRIIKISEFKKNPSVIRNTGFNTVLSLLDDISYAVNDQKERLFLLKAAIGESMDMINCLGEHGANPNGLGRFLKIVIANTEMMTVFIRTSSPEILKYALKLIHLDKNNSDFFKKKENENILIDCLNDKNQINKYVHVLDEFCLIRPMLILVNHRFDDIDKNFIRTKIYKYIRNNDYEIILNALEIILKAKSENIIDIDLYADDLINVFMERCLLDDIGIYIIYILGPRIENMTKDIFFIDPVMFSSHYQIRSPTFSMILALAKEIEWYRFSDSVFEDNGDQFSKIDTVHKTLVLNRTKNNHFACCKYKFKPSAMKIINLFKACQYDDKQITELLTMILDFLDSETLGKRNKTIYIRILGLFQGDKHFFYRICEFIANEKNIDVALEMVQVLKKSKYKEFIEKMKDNQKLKRLLLRIYPVNLVDKVFYRSLVDFYRDLPETDVILEYYKLNYTFLSRL